MQEVVVQQQLVEGATNQGKEGEPAGEPVVITDADMIVAMGTAVPPENKLQLNLTETINVDGKTFLFTPPNCTDSVWLYCCPWSPFIKYVSKDTETLKYKNQCICCCLPWEASINNAKIGFTTAPKCCDNGVCFCLCPWCVCTGEIIMQFFHGIDGQKKYTIRRDLFPCWPCVSCCAPCGICFGCCADCFSYCKNENYVSIREELRGVGHNAPILGYIHTVDRVEPIGCCPIRMPVRYSVELTGGPDGKDLHMLGLIPLLYRGAAVPCRCFAAAPVPRITGVWCIDAGRHRKIQRFTATRMMAALEAPENTYIER